MHVADSLPIGASSEMQRSNHIGPWTLNNIAVATLLPHCTLIRNLAQTLSWEWGQAGHS
jgi:hypothetical protein